MTSTLTAYAKHKEVSRAEALRMSMLQVMQTARGNHAYFVHPFVWASFFIVGESGPSNHNHASLQFTVANKTD